MLDMALWDQKQVQRWLGGLGMPQYVDMFTFHNISGESLVAVDQTDLEEIGVQSLGHRVHLLRAINQHLHRPVEHNMGLKSATDLGAEIAALRLKLKKVVESHNKLRQDMLPAIRRAKEQVPLPLPAGGASPTHSIHSARQPTHNPGSARSTAAASVSPSADTFEHKERQSSRQNPATPLGERVSMSRLGYIEEDSDSVHSLSARDLPALNGQQVVHATVKNGAPISMSTASEPFKSFRVTLEDPCTKVLQAVLKRFKIVSDPSNYSLLVFDGNKERELRTDEKPLMVFKELQDSGQRPVFIVRQLAKSASLTPSSRLHPAGMI